VDNTSVRSGCLVCSGAASRVHVAKGVCVQRCRSCGFRWATREELHAQAPAPSYQDYRHNRILRQGFEAMKPQYLAGLKQRVARNFPDRSPAELSFVDVGCANGEYLWAAREMGFGTVVGVEIDEVSAANAREFGDVAREASSLPEASFDVVQVKNVLGNVVDFREFLTQSAALARPGGVVLVDVPNEDAFSAAGYRLACRLHLGSGTRYGHLSPPYMVNGFGRRSLGLLLSQVGLRVIWQRTMYVGHVLIPYRTRSWHTVLGAVATRVGRGPMLLTESTRAGQSVPAGVAGNPGRGG
jgi:SAM-dependent methyltransferase